MTTLLSAKSTTPDAPPHRHPTLAGAWLCPSGRDPSQFHLVTTDRDVAIRCTCPAGKFGRACRHLASVTLAAYNARPRLVPTPAAVAQAHDDLFGEVA